ncbi:hypothetical protein ACFFYR_25370 [Paraburkholderia dipogonis]
MDYQLSADHQAIVDAAQKICTDFRSEKVKKKKNCRKKDKNPEFPPRIL